MYCLLLSFRHSFLHSKPIAVPDRMATKRSPASAAFAIGVHVVIILLVALFIASQVKVMTSAKKDVAAVVAATATSDCT